MHLNAQGINILDSNGNAFLATLSAGQQSKATIPRRNLQGRPDLLELWREVLSEYDMQVPADMQQAQAPAQQRGKKGIKALTSQAKKVDPQQSLHPQPNDAIYILQSFLDTFFPQGGTFVSISKTDCPALPAHLDELRNFLKQPQWTGHPYLDSWLGKIDIEKP